MAVKTVSIPVDILTDTIGLLLDLENELDEGKAIEASSIQHQRLEDFISNLNAKMIDLGIR